MRTTLLVIWLLIPAVAAAYHWGPGQGQLRLDDASTLLAQADRLAEEQQWLDAIAKYDQALAILPPERLSDIRRVRLERAKAQMLAKQLPEAHKDLTALVDEMVEELAAQNKTAQSQAAPSRLAPNEAADSQASPKPAGMGNTRPHADLELLADARSALANSQYYMTWLMRLEGLPRAAWEPEIESARENYRLLAEQAQTAGDSSAVRRNQEDLESAIRLARMDLKELQGLPLPSQ